MATCIKEDALRIALETRNKILEKEVETSTILRGCFIVAQSLGDLQKKGWIELELSGYSKG